jgi:choline dehydrogenase-like flavoprotein
VATDPFDVVVVGSGATGGWVAKQLTEAGLRVAVLEAGRKLDPARDYSEHKQAWDMPLRGRRLGWREQVDEQPIQSKCYQCDEYTNHLFVKDTENPYTTAPGKPFDWIRGRQVGGKSITWGRQTYRLSDFDFKAASRDGHGDDWPISHADIAPYYDRVEAFVGVSGQAEGLPQLPDGRFLPPMQLTCGEQLLRKTIKAKFPGRTLTIGRCAILTRELNGRPPCHYCGPCSRGCSSGSYYSSPHSTLPAAEKTGRLTLIPNVVVSHVVPADDGKAKGVYFIDRITRAHGEVTGKVVVLSASTLETTRILLNSLTYRDNERKMVEDMANTAEEMLRAVGAQFVGKQAEISTPGLAIHEVGTARMGNDPKTSVVNRWQQAHDVKNLFLMDGSVYVSSACPNPTITLMALAARACDYLVEEFRGGRL